MPRRKIEVKPKPRLRLKRRGRVAKRNYFGAFEEITDQYLEDTVNDCRRLKSSQHAIQKHNLIKICKELLRRRKEVKK